MNLLRALARLGLLGLLVLTTTAVRAAPQRTLAIEGPTAVSVGGRIELRAEAGTSDGTFAWRLAPRPGTVGGRAAPVDERVRLVPRGRRLLVVGRALSGSVGDVEVVLDHRLDGVVQEARVSLSVVDGELTAYRPQHGSSYFPHTRTAVPDAQETDDELGPGIRRDGASDSDPGAEDDLIELRLTSSFAPFDAQLRRTTGALRVWNTRRRVAGSEVAFQGSVSEALAVGAAGRTVWIEWDGSHGLGDLTLQPAGTLDGRGALDRVRLHTFRSIVLALGGEGQVPMRPVDPNHGAFVTGIELYRLGYDVFLYDEDGVSPSGSGVVYSEVVNALTNRGVDEVACFGYSHGGGSTWDLVDRLDANRAGLPVFSVPYTGYVDGVENDSDTDVQQENKYPPSSAFHVNHHQVGSFGDFFLDGGPVPGAVPGNGGLNVETTAWGAGADHFVVDDYAQVIDAMHAYFLPRVSR